MKRLVRVNSVVLDARLLFCLRYRAAHKQDQQRNRQEVSSSVLHVFIPSNLNELPWTPAPKLPHRLSLSVKLAACRVVRSVRRLSATSRGSGLPPRRANCSPSRFVLL